ncbi:MAG TPA: serine hydrolase domain-containing protein [Rhizomicrobium sp.]
MTAKPSSIAELETWIEETLQDAGTPGAAVDLERAGERLLARGFGRRDVEAGPELDVETVFGCGSVTKSLTALAILLLEEEGKLATSDAVSSHLPQLRLPGPPVAPITIYHLLTHTSGLPPLPSRHYAWLSQDDLETFERAALERLPPREPIRSLEELIAFLSEYPFALHAPPGEQFSYSNEGYNLLGAIVERVSGKSLPAFMHERILAPAGMNRSSLDLQFTLGLPHVTKLHVRQDGKIVTSANWFNPACWSAAGALRSTATDLVRYFRMLASDGLLDGVRIASVDSVRKMTRTYTARDHQIWYGYGLQVSDLSGHALAYHGGGQKGVAAFAGFAAAEGVVCAVLTNLADSPVERIWAACMRAALGLPPGPLHEPATPIDLELDTLRSFAGAYHSPEAGRIRVVVDDSGRVRVTAGGVSARALPVAKDSLMFAGPRGEQTIRFLRLGGSDVSHAFHGGRVISRVETPAEGPH